MKYEEWNGLIAKHFFNEGNGQKEVLLYINEEIINEIGKNSNTDINDFISAIKNGPAGIKNRGICQKAFKIYKNWRRNAQNREYPPYIAYLAFFVLVSTREKEDVNDNAYYSRFEELLGEKGHPSFNKMEKLWEDLELWCNDEKKESLGKLVVRARGKWRHVGWPWSQTLLSDNERKHLGQIFYEADLDPADMPSPTAILKIILKSGRKFLENRTIKIIENGKEDVRMALALLILSELEQWDESEIQILEQTERTSLKNKNIVKLKICLKFDKTNRKIEGYFRIKTKRDFPEGILNFQTSNKSDNYTCYLCGNTEEGNWSTKIKNSKGDFLNALNVNWNKDSLIFYDDVNNWKFKIKGNDLRLFIPGNEENIPDWIECEHLDRGKEFYIAVCDKKQELIKKWGLNNCKKFEQFDFEGLPSGWKLFHGKNAKSPCMGISQLEISSLVKIKLIGNPIKKNTYLCSDPPEVFIENGAGEEKVLMNGQELICDDNNDSKIWKIPDNLSPTNRIKLEIINNSNEILYDRFISLEEPKLPDEFDTPGRDKTGVVPLEKNPNIFGVIVKEKYFSLKMPRLYRGLLLKYGFKEAIFIGKDRWQLKYVYSKDRLPNWQPVWAIIKDDKGNYQIFNPSILNFLQLSNVIDPRIKNSLEIKTTFRDFLKKIRNIGDSHNLKDIWSLLNRLEVKQNG